MNFFYPLLPLAAATAFTAAAHGQTARFLRNGTLVISDGSHRIQIADVSKGADYVPTAPCVHAILKRKGEYFVVITTSEWTRGYPPKGGAGGAGEEAYIRWLHVVDRKVSESVGGRFRSWRDNREGGIGGWRGSLFTVTTEDLLEDRDSSEQKEIWQTITWTFDAKRPESGLKEDKGAPHA